MVLPNEGAPSTPITYETLPRAPMYVIALHRLARLGRATRYSNSKRYVQFAVEYPMAAKFVGLGDVERITLIYKDRYRIREVSNAATL